MKDVFTEVKQESTRDKVYGALRDAVISGRLRTGQKLTEVGLANTFKVSRSVIREALREMVRDGLVVQNAYKSTTVVRLTPQQVDEILSVRLLLETEAIRLVHGRLTDDERQRLRQMADELDKASADRPRHAALDLALHAHLWHLSGNRTLESVLRQLTAPLFAMGVIVRSSPALRTLAGETAHPADHQVLVRAICEGTADAAVAALTAHVRLNWQRIKEHLETFEKAGGIDRPSTTRGSRASSS